MEAETKLFMVEFDKARKLSNVKRTRDRITDVIPVHKLNVETCRRVHLSHGGEIDELGLVSEERHIC